MPVVKMPDGALVELPDNPTPEQLAQLDAVMKPQSSLPREALAVGDKIVRGGFLGLPRAIGELVKAKEGQLTGDNVESFTPAGLALRARKAVVPESVDQAILSAMTPQQPQTTAGKYIGAAGEGAVGAMVGGPLKQAGNLAQVGAASGLGSEAAAHAFGDNMLTRLLGGLAAGGPTAFLKARKPNEHSIVKTATQGMTKDDWQRARSNEMALTDMGMPHLKSQLLGPTSSLDDVVAQASSNPEVRPKLLQAVRGTKEKARQNVEAFSDSTLPVQVDERRDFMLDLQRKAAEREAELTRGANNAYRQKLPPGFDGEVYPEAYIKSLRQELVAMAKNAPAGYGMNTDHARFLTNFIQDKLRTKGNGMSKNELNNIYKEINAFAANSNYSGKAIRDLKDTIKSFTPEVQPARDAASAFYRAEVEPMKEGLAGDIARARGGVTPGKYTATDATNAVFPADRAQPLAIKKLAEDVGGEQVGLLLRDYLTKNFERVSKGLPHEGERSPAAFVKAVVGTEAQRRNVEAALAESARAQGQNPYAVKEGFRKLINAFSTYDDLKLSGGVSPAALGFEAGKNAAGTVLAPNSRAGRWFWERTSTATYQKIADLVTSKDGLAKLEAIARSRDPSYAQALLQSMIVTSQPDEQNTGELQSSNPGGL